MVFNLMEQARIRTLSRAHTHTWSYVDAKLVVTQDFC